MVGRCGEATGDAASVGEAGTDSSSFTDANAGTDGISATDAGANTDAGDVTLAGTLMICLLASEFFLPLRILGSFFHIAMNGMAASDRIFAFLDRRGIRVRKEHDRRDPDREKPRL